MFSWKLYRGDRNRSSSRYGGGWWRLRVEPDTKQGKADETTLISIIIYNKCILGQIFASRKNAILTRS